MLARCNKLSEALVLVARHRPVTSTLQGQIGLEVRVQVLLQRHIANEAHTAERAVEFYAGEDLALGRLRRSVQTYGRSEERKMWMGWIEFGRLDLTGDTYLRRESLLANEGHYCCYEPG